MYRTSLALITALTLGLGLVGCGDHEEGKNRGTNTGGAAGAETGGSQLGGAETGGSQPGGADTGGSQPGGADTGGSEPGGADTGGSEPGGADTGGTGGSDTGGTGGTDTGGQGGAESCTVAFVSPTDGEVLDETDDASGDLCEDGFQYNVVVATDALNGADATLYAGGQQIATASVASASARFQGVQLQSNATSELRVTIEDGTTCEATASVDVECTGHPSCEIVAPEITDTHPALNGVPADEGGDRVSSPGSAYQVAFQVATNIADGQFVVLDLSDGSQATARALGGVAAFAGVTMEPDGEFTVTASCVAATGATGVSSESQYTVDTLPPPLQVYKDQAGAVTLLESGDHWDLADDGDGDPENGLQLRICGTTEGDALDLPASLGDGQSNFCAAVGTSSPLCAAATTGGAGDAGSGDGACVDVACPGSGAFALTLEMRDEAGNVTSVTAETLTCTSQVPQVQFVDPVSDGPPWSDVSQRILAASMPDDQRKDQDAAQSGAQYDVSVCANEPISSAELSVGRVGSALSTSGVLATIKADTAGVCPNGFEVLISFVGATLPESVTDVDGMLDIATRLQVTVVTEENASASATADLWVDSVLPQVQAFSPAGLCELYIDSSTPTTQDMVFTSTTEDLHLFVEGTEVTGGVPRAFDRVEFQDVPLAVGVNAIEVEAVEPSGNVGGLPEDCAVLVSDTAPVVVTWVSPTLGAALTHADTVTSVSIPDADAGTGGWQGTLSVCTNIDPVESPSAEVQFASSVGGDLGSPVALDSSGCASLDVTLPDDPATVLTATATRDSGGDTGTRSLTVPVDVTPPPPPSDLVGSVVDRRATTLHIEWTAPDDVGGQLSGYDVRVAPTVIDTSAKFAAAEFVPFGGAPSGGGTDGLDVVDRYIENDYYFAVAALDAVGNVSAFGYTSDPTRTEFESIVLTPQATAERFGSTIDGAGDLNGDGYADLVVGRNDGMRVHIHLGSDTAITASPDVTITGEATTFGASVANIGDVNDDGIDDLAIGAWEDGNGKVYVFFGREVWPTTLSHLEADLLVSPDAATDAGLTNSAFGFVVARIGDFDGGDGAVDDFAIGAPNYDGGRGFVTIVRGNAALGGTLSIPSSTAAIELKGPAGSTGRFGRTLLGLGPFYTSASGQTSLVVGAPYAAGYAGTLYAFRGELAPTGAILASSAAHTLDGEVAGAAFGFAPPSALGPLGVGARPAFALPVTELEASGRALAFSGSNTDGPFYQQLARFKTAEEPAGARRFARMVVGTAVAGTLRSKSLLGSSSPDLVVSTRAGDVPRLFIVDGDYVNAGASDTDIETVAVVEYALPTSVTPDFARQVTAIQDLNGDGYADLAVGAIDYGATPVDGLVVVLY